MLHFVAFLSLLLVGAPIFGAEPPPASVQDQESHRQALLPVEQPLLKKVFRSQFSKEQLAQFKDAPSLEQLVQSMSPEQRQAARTGLAGLEAKAKTPAELAQIARGYLMLDEQGPDCGQNVFRVAAQMEQLDPGSPVGPTIAAEAFFKIGDYPAATEAAKKALKLDPEDPNANTIYYLSRGRNGSAKESVGGADHAFLSPSSSEEALPKRQDSKQPTKPVVQGKRNPIVVPSLAKTDAGAEAGKPVSLPPLPLAIAALGMAFAGYGIYRARKNASSEDTSPEASPAPAIGTESSPEGILDIADRYVAGAKTFVQDHPVASATAAIVALGIIIRVGGPIIAAGSGVAAGTQIVAGSGGAAALGRAAMKVLPMPAIETWRASAVAALGGGSLLLMGGDSNERNKPSSEGKEESRQEEATGVVEDILRKPESLSGKTPEGIEKGVKGAKNWKVDALGRGSQKGKGWVLREYGENGEPTGRLIRWHPGGGHHGPKPYWKVSSPTGGISGEIR